MALAAQTSEYRRGKFLCSPMSKRLFDAVKSCRMAQVKILVLKNQLDVNTRCDNGENCLIEALRIENDKKRRATFSFLLKCGIDIHNRDTSGRDALEWAVKLNCKREALQLLNGPMIEYDFHHKDCEGLTILHHATINNMEEVVRTIVKRLQRYRISVDIPDSLQYTPYLYAKDLKLDEITAILAAAGASIHVEKRDESRSIDRNMKENTGMAQLVKLTGKGKMPHLKKLFIAEKHGETTPTKNFRKSQMAISTNISSLLQLKSDGKICDNFVHSSTAAFTDSPDTVLGPTNSSYTFNSSMFDLQEIFDMVSEQMTQSFCKPAQKPKPKAIIFHQNKSTVKRSALAAIMKKPMHQTADRKRKPHLVKKASRSDMNVKPNFLSVIPTIKTTFSKT